MTAAQWKKDPAFTCRPGQHIVLVGHFGRDYGYPIFWGCYNDDGEQVDYGTADTIAEAKRLGLSRARALDDALERQEVARPHFHLNEEPFPI